MYKLSIIIPVYNEAPYLKRCLNSLRWPEKNLHDVEVIMIDDGSTDGSAEILDKEIDRVGFKILHHQVNWGVSMTRNHGLSIATGDYVAFLDSDDAMCSDGIEILLNHIENHDDNVMQFNHYRCHDGKCSTDSRFYSPPGIYYIKDLPPKWVTVWNKLYKLSFLNEHEIRFPADQGYDEDRQFNLQCLHYAKQISYFFPTTICKYFDNKQSICHTMSKEKLAKALKKLVDRLVIEDDPELRMLIKKNIIQHLESKNFKEVFGGDV